MQQNEGNRMGLRDLVARLHAVVWAGSTTEVELVLALLIAFRASWMLVPVWQSIPLETLGYFIPPGWPEWGYGTLLMAGASAQAMVALVRAPVPRACIAALLAAFQTSVTLAYWQGGYAYRGVVPWIMGLALVEWWVSWRAWSDRFVTHTAIDRRHYGGLHADRATPDG